MLVGGFHSQASTIDNVDTQINTIPIDDSYPTENQDLHFEDISLKKNNLYINSDSANITDLNSGKIIFTFSGNVEIISEIVIIKCDKAILEFEENQLKNAKFIGELSSFQQFDKKRELIASGTAEVFEYDHTANILRMETNAWVNNGSNEVSGNLITYNLVKRNIIADSENGSPVKLIIDSTSIN
jgi:lipopolysaccharide transport protein LptA